MFQQIITGVGTGVSVTSVLTKSTAELCKSYDKVNSVQFCTSFSGLLLLNVLIPLISIIFFGCIALRGKDFVLSLTKALAKGKSE